VDNLTLPEDFVDLYCGPDFCDVKVTTGVDAPRLDVYQGREAECRRLYEACQARMAEAGDKEFTFRVNELQLRATCIHDVDDQPIFVLRKLKAIPALEDTGLDDATVEFLLDPSLTGLVIFSGPQASGKTSSAASLLRERLRRHGGIAIAVEDPAETDLNGTHNKGRCLQISASAADGGYPVQVARALRTGSSQIFIGEIREPGAAAQAVHASINGHLILTTIHAGNIPQALERLCSQAAHTMSNPYSIVGEGISCVVWQEMRRGRQRSLVLTHSLMFPPGEEVMREKIRKGEIASLKQDIELRVHRMAWQE
jgi:Tfp pilus assembly ATPase PilU